jgi:hypothetical protein
MNKGAAKTSGKLKSSGPNYAPSISLDILVRQETDREVYVMPVRKVQDHYFKIDGLAADLWNAFDGTTTIKEHTDRLMREYKNVPPSKIKKDVSNFVASLKKLGLLD